MVTPAVAGLTINKVVESTAIPFGTYQTEITGVVVTAETASDEETELNVGTVPLALEPAGQAYKVFVDPDDSPRIFHVFNPEMVFGQYLIDWKRFNPVEELVTAIVSFSS